MNDTKSAQHDDSLPVSLRERKKRLAQAAIVEPEVLAQVDLGEATLAKQARESILAPLLTD